MVERSPEFLTPDQNLADEVSVSGLSVAARQRILDQEGITAGALASVKIYDQPAFVVSRSVQPAPRTIDTSAVS